MKDFEQIKKELLVELENTARIRREKPNDGEWDSKTNVKSSKDLMELCDYIASLPYDHGLFKELDRAKEKYAREVMCDLKSFRVLRDYDTHEAVALSVNHLLYCRECDQAKLSSDQLREIMKLANEAAQGLVEFEGSHHYTVLVHDDGDYTLIASDISCRFAQRDLSVVLEYSVIQGRVRLIGTFFNNAE